MGIPRINRPCSKPRSNGTISRFFAMARLAFSPSLALALTILLSSTNSGAYAHGHGGESHIAAGKYVSQEPIVGRPARDGWMPDSWGEAEAIKSSDDTPRVEMFARE